MLLEWLGLRAAGFCQGPDYPRRGASVTGRAERAVKSEGRPPVVFTSGGCGARLTRATPWQCTATAVAPSCPVHCGMTSCWCCHTGTGLGGGERPRGGGGRSLQPQQGHREARHGQDARCVRGALRAKVKMHSGCVARCAPWPRCTVETAFVLTCSSQLAHLAVCFGGVAVSRSLVRPVHLALLARPILYSLLSPATPVHNLPLVLPACLGLPNDPRPITAIRSPLLAYAGP